MRGLRGALARAASAALLVASISIVVSELIAAALSRELAREWEGSDELQHFSRAASYLNSSAAHIARRKPGYDISSFELIRTYARLKAKYEELLNTPGAEYWRVARVNVYLNFSRVNNILYNVTFDLHMLWGDVVRSTKELGLARVESALEIYASREFALNRVISDLGEALSILSSTKFSEHALEEHRSIAESSARVLSEVLDLLSEYRELMEILERNAGKLYSGNASDLALVSELVASTIDPRKLGLLAVDVSNFVSQLKSIAEAGGGLQRGDRAAGSSSSGVPYD